MTPRRQHVDPPASADGVRLYTLDEVQLPAVPGPHPGRLARARGVRGARMNAGAACAARMSDGDRASYSRFEVLCAERPAWVQPALRGKEHFYFDGRGFWRRRRAGGESLLPSWRAPRYGWVHESGCDCPLCGAQGAAATRRRASRDAASA